MRLFNYTGIGYGNLWISYNSAPSQKSKPNRYDFFCVNNYRMIIGMSHRIDREIRTVSAMIHDYCRAHHARKENCQECLELLDYATERLRKCPFREGKTTCNKCPVHCFKPEMREKISVVMRYSGPRMIIFHPILVIFHSIDGRRKEPISPFNRAQ